MKTRTPKIATVRGREIRTIAAQLEARDLGGLEFIVSGYASRTDHLYDMGSYRERVQPGAFAGTLSGRPDVQLLINHGSGGGSGMPLARTTVPPGQVGHLSLAEDHNGLHFSAQLDREDDEAQTLMRRITAGVIDGASFAFRVTEQSWNDDRTIRTIQAVDIHRGDVSVCNQGANDAASVAARSSSSAGYPLDLAQAITRSLHLRNEAGRRR